jgi:hypothetical protein
MCIEQRIDAFLYAVAAMQSLLNVIIGLDGLIKNGPNRRRVSCMAGSAILFASSLVASDKLLVNGNVEGSSLILVVSGGIIALLFLTVAALVRYTCAATSLKRNLYYHLGLFTVTSLCILSLSWGIKLIAMGGTSFKSRQAASLPLLALPLGHIYFGLRLYIKHVKPFQRDRGWRKRMLTAQGWVTLTLVLLWIFWIVTLGSGIARNSSNMLLISVSLFLESRMNSISNALAPLPLQPELVDASNLSVELH